MFRHVIFALLTLSVIIGSVLSVSPETQPQTKEEKKAANAAARAEREQKRLEMRKEIQDLKELNRNLTKQLNEKTKLLEKSDENPATAGSASTGADQDELKTLKDQVAAVQAQNQKLTADLQQCGETASAQAEDLKAKCQVAECPTSQGYVLINSIQPPLCLRLDAGPKLYDAAQAACEEEGANLVRVKTLDIYNVVKDFLVDAGYTDWVLIGANDKQTEGEFYWNDGTPLPLGSDVWNLPTNEGYNDHEDCTALSTSMKIIDTTCDKYPKAFVCQFDVL